ncbi:MAG: hypothetical protein RQ745_00250 [Longimicrobiales bacterium]|nr:hypothetical protein [Longimicrobiales bacterium]
MTDSTGQERPQRRVVSTLDERGDPSPARYAIPFDRVWRAALGALDAEGARIELADDLAGVARAWGKGGVPRHEWSAEIRVSLDDDAQTRVDLTVTLRAGVDLGRTRRRARRILAVIDSAIGADARTRLRIARSAVLALPIVVATLSACTEGPTVEPAREAVVDSPIAIPSTVPARSYERAFVFHTSERDSAFGVVWLFDHLEHETGIERSARGVLLRGSVWDDFFEATSVDPPSSTPWRIAPSGPLRLVVGTGDRVDHVIFDDGVRHLDLAIDEEAAAWTGRHGGTFRLHDARVVIGDRAVPGRLLDLSRSRLPDAGPSGDWLLLTSGTALTLVLQAPGESRAEGGWQGWVLQGGEEFLFPDATLEWTESRAYDDARREVPVAWTLRTRDGGLSGTLQVDEGLLRAGEGEGPLLPVDGLLAVTGVVTIDGTARNVEGLLRHRQGAPR